MQRIQTITIKLTETPSGARRLTVTHVNSNGTNRHFRHRDYGLDLIAQADAIADEMATLMCVTLLGVIQPHITTADKWLRTYAMTENRYASLPLCK
jgi:hypothetical protein